VLFSLGVSGCCFVIAAAIVTNWFVEKRGFALGLVMSGMGVGQLIFIPANLFIIDRLGWRDTMSLLSIIIMVIAGPLFILFLRSRPEEKGLKPYGYADTGHDFQNAGNGTVEGKTFLPVAGVFKHKAFWLLSITYFICGFTDVGLIQTHLIPIIGLKGLPVSAAAIAFSLISVFSIAGTIVTGHFSDRFNRPKQLAVIYITRAMTFLFLIFIRRQWQLMIFAVVNGTMDMANIAPTNSLTAQLFEKYSIGMVIGFIAIGHLIGGAFGSWIPGLLYDMTGSYYTVLILSIIMLIGGAFIALRVPEPK
jgi:MFS family permease